MHDKVMLLEKRNHNKDKSCLYCNNLLKIHKEKLTVQRQNQAIIDKENYMKKYVQIIQDPSVSPN